MDGIDDYNEKMFKKVETARLADGESLIALNEKQSQQFEDMLQETEDIG